jgi:hypothetical protein
MWNQMYTASGTNENLVTKLIVPIAQKALSGLN